MRSVLGVDLVGPVLVHIFVTHAVVAHFFFVMASFAIPSLLVSSATVAFFPLSFGMLSVFTFCANAIPAPTVIHVAIAIIKIFFIRFSFEKMHTTRCESSMKHRNCGS